VLRLRWKQVLDDRAREDQPQEFSSPVAAGGRIYAGTRDGSLYAFDARSGKVEWHRKTGSVSTRPGYATGRLYVGTAEGNLIALAASDGEELWRYESKSAILRTPVIAGDTIYFSNDADVVYALDRVKGDFLWQYKAEQSDEFTLRGHAGVSVTEDHVLSGFSNGTVVALRTGTGSVAWITSLTAGQEQFVDVDSQPIVDGDSVYVVSTAGGVYALDLSTGLVRWRLPVEGAGGIASDGERLYFAAANEGVFAADRGGNVLWRQGTAGGGEPVDPVVTGDYVIYTLSADGVFVADKRTGRLHQFFDPGTGVSGLPLVDGDNLYVLSNGGILYALAIERF